MLLAGRTTWQLFAERWPARTDDFATAMNRAPKYVASRTLESVDAWSNSFLLDDELTVAVERLRGDRNVVVVGSTSIVRQLATADLVDEYRLFVFPTVVGAGERLFADGGSAELRPVAAELSGAGVLLRFAVEHAG